MLYYGHAPLPELRLVSGDRNRIKSKFHGTHSLFGTLRQFMKLPPFLPPALLLDSGSGGADADFTQHSKTYLSCVM